MTVFNVDCRAGMAWFPDNTFDSIVCDPPYELGFMGKSWDSTGIAYDPLMWADALRVLKPGGHLLAFSSSRTYHRMVCAIEDAGFEIRDQIMWIYGSGFPKSRDVSKAIDSEAGAVREEIGEARHHAKRKDREIMNGGYRDDYHFGGARIATAPATEAAQHWQGWGTALKPAHEPICVARKPLVGTVAQNVLQFGTGAINIDGCRVEGESTLRACNAGTGNAENWRTGNVAGTHGSDAGRWPANVIHDGSGEVLAAFPLSNSGKPTGKPRGRRAGGFGDVGAEKGDGVPNGPQYGDAGSAAGFFKQINTSEDAVWADVELPSLIANIADASLSQRRQAAVSVLAHVASLALPAGLCCANVSTEPFTSATQIELKQISVIATQAIQSIAERFWHESQPAKLSLSLNRANVVVSRGQIGITTITVSHWKSDGSADHVTYSIMPTNSEVGGKDCAPFTASRVFYCAKASKRDRGAGNTHPTVKPTDLMRYLCRLVTPPDGSILDPFAGSGSTGKAAALEGFTFIGFELDAQHTEIANARIKAAA